MAAALNNSLHFDRVSLPRGRLAGAQKCMEDEVRREGGFEDIVGISAPLDHVLRQVEAVASTDSTVLILGESGTGKELIARAIHDRSVRSDQAFIKVDCYSRHPDRK